MSVMKRKLVFITEALWIGGIETALVNLLNRLDYNKYAVTCLVIRASLEVADRITPKCRLIVADREKTVSFRKAYGFARLYHLTEHSENPSRLHKAMMWAVPTIKWVENRLYIRYIRKQLAAEQFDTCIIYSDRTAETAVRAVRANKYLMFYHHGGMRKVYHDEIGYRRSEKIIAVSEGQERQLRGFRPQYAHKMTTVKNLIDIEGIQEKAQEPVAESFDAELVHIVSCGRLAPEKGMDLAVEAAAMLVLQGHRNIHWWIVGGGPAYHAVKNQISKLNMPGYVTMLGMKQNPYPYIKKADLYVQPSRVESYGLTIAEAMILGKPIIATATDGARALLDDAFLCNSTADALAAAIANSLARGFLPQNHNRFEEENQLAVAQLDVLMNH